MPASVFAHNCKLLYTKPMLTRNCSVTRQSSTSGTECHTVLVGSLVQLQETVSADTGSRGVPYGSQAYVMLNDYSRCVVIWQQENGTELGCPCVCGYFWNWTFAFCVELVYATRRTVVSVYQSVLNWLISWFIVCCECFIHLLRSSRVQGRCPGRRVWETESLRSLSIF